MQPAARRPRRWPQLKRREGAIWLDTLDVSKMTSGWDGIPPQAGKSIEGNPLKLQGVTYPHGIGTHARSDMVINLRGSAKRLSRWSAWTTRSRTWVRDVSTSW